MLAALAFAVALSGPQTARLDAVMRYVMRDHAIHAMTVGVVRDGQVTLRAYGHATPRTVFAIGSLAKSFVAATALRLRDGGTLSLQMRVGEIDARFTQARDVTLEQLLRQRSGIAEYADTAGFDRSSTRIVAPRELIASVATLPLRFTPGSDFEYSNTNYALAGLAIEDVTHHTLIAQEQRMLFNPLHLRATRRYLRASQLYAAGDLESNARDMTDWMHELLDPHILTRADVKAMTNGVPYGMGFFVTSIYGMPAATTSGYVPGFSSFLALVPARRTGVVLLSDADRVDLGPAAQSAIAAALDIPE